MLSAIRAATAAFTVVTSLLPAAVAAQESRAAAISQEQAEKATRLHPYEPGRAEGLVIRAERALGSQPTGLYPWFGSIYSGGLMSFGPGFRQPFGGGGAIDAQAAISLKGYKLGRATVLLPPMADRRVRVAARAEIVDAPSVAFYGVGNDSLRDSRSTYLFRPTTVGASLSVLPVRHVEVGTDVQRLSVKTGGGRRGTSIVNLFTTDTVPGLEESPDFTVTSAHAAYDWRDSPGYSRNGGYYRIDWSHFSDGDGHYSFRRVDADLRQMVPLLRENWVLAFRAAVSTTSTDAGHEVPYFLMPDLGGGSDLRGYPTWRFRDRNSILVSAEYRWTPSRVIDMAIFHDAGKVTAERADLSLSRLKHTNGIGIRLHAPAATFLRFELARGAEGIGIVMAFGQSF